MRVSRSGTPVPLPKRKGSCCSLVSLVCIGTVLGVALWVYTEQHRDRPYCCENMYYKSCKPCPENATCRDGKKTCHKGYKDYGSVCVRDDEYNAQVEALAKRISESIAKEVDNACNTVWVNETEIRRLYDNYPETSAALRLLNHYRIREKTIDGMLLYQSDEAILPLQCQIRAICRENKPAVTFVVILTAGILGFIFGGIRKQRIGRAINNRVQEIIGALQSDRTTNFKYASNFEVVETHPLWKYWNQIVARVESNPDVVALNSSNGRMWRCETYH